MHILTECLDGKFSICHQLADVVQKDQDDNYNENVSSAVQCTFTAAKQLIAPFLTD